MSYEQAQYRSLSKDVRKPIQLWALAKDLKKPVQLWVNAQQSHRYGTWKQTLPNRKNESAETQNFETYEGINANIQPLVRLVLTPTCSCCHVTSASLMSGI